MTSSTLVATWSWTTWVAESTTCSGSRVHLVGVSISFEKKFYRLSFTPPSLVITFSPSLLAAMLGDLGVPTLRSIKTIT
jgi:hypothetical protein